MRKPIQTPAQLIMMNEALQGSSTTDKATRDRRMVALIGQLKNIVETNADIFQFNNSVFVVNQIPNTNVGYVRFFTHNDPDMSLSILQFLSLMQRKNINKIIFNPDKPNRAKSMADRLSSIVNKTGIDTKVHLLRDKNSPRRAMAVDIGSDDIAELQGVL